MTDLTDLSEEDWNIDEVKGDHESDEHWELRRNFLIQNKGKFPKLRLLSLSAVFANVEFLGCRYPDETMELVAELSAGIVEEYRKARAGRLQRTFVKASDAAEKKSKGTKRASTSASLCASPKVFIRERPTAAVFPSGALDVKDMKRFENLKGLILVDQVFQEKEGAIQIINRSCGMSRKKLDISYNYAKDGCTICVIKIEDCFQVEGKGVTKESARNETATLALEKLREFCYTIEVKSNVVSSVEFGKTEINGFEDQPQSDEISETNVGAKLLRLMGWEGGGLGRDNQGITAPIKTSSNVETIQRSRLGLGLVSESVEFVEIIRKFLKSQIWQCEQFDLKFSPEFNSDERKIIHQIAGQLGMKSRSHGKGDNRFLVVSKKIQLNELVEELLNAGGETPKYRIILPHKSS